MLVSGASVLLLAAGGDARAQAERDSPIVPGGFRVDVFAEGLGAPSGMAFGPDGVLYVIDAGTRRVLGLVDGDSDGEADTVFVVWQDVGQPLGIAWHGDELWVVEPSRVIGLLPGSGGAVSGEVRVVADGFSGATGALAFEPGGRGFFLAVGSSCSSCPATELPNGVILRYRVERGDPEVWARGLGHSTALAFHPQTGELWATDEAREEPADDVVREELNVIRRGRHYGWPYCYGARIPGPEYADWARCEATEPPMLTFPSRSSPRGMTFYDGDVFPVEYRGDAFVALRGSTSGSITAGYKVVRVKVEAGRPIAAEDFMGGWLGLGGRLFGRPLQPLVGPDGALYVSDEICGRVWRVTYAAGRGLGEVAGESRWPDWW